MVLMSGLYDLLLSFPHCSELLSYFLTVTHIERLVSLWALYVLFPLCIDRLKGRS